MFRNALTRRSSTTPAIPDPFNRFFDRFFEPDFLRTGNWITSDLPDHAWLPAVDSHQTEAAYVLDVDLPGLKREDVHVTVENNVLTLTGERKFARDNGSADNYDRIERAYGRFSRSFTLPNHVDAENVKASFENGVLTITLPKLEQARSREIKIQ